MNEIAIQDLAQLRSLPSGFHCGKPMETSLVRRILELCDAMWLHSGDPMRPHAELTSGNCSNGYINMSVALSYPNVCEMLAHQVVLAFHKEYQNLEVHWVIGSSYASIALSFMVAKLLGARHGFTEKGSDGKQLWRRHIIEPEETVLQVEELVTTLKTLAAVRTGIREGNPDKVTFASASLVAVHRSDTYEFDGDPLLNVAHFDIQSWEQHKCPLCATGSPRLRPKGNWKALTQPDD